MTHIYIYINVWKHLTTLLPERHWSENHCTVFMFCVRHIECCCLRRAHSPSISLFVVSCWFGHWKLHVLLVAVCNFWVRCVSCLSLPVLLVLRGPCVTLHVVAWEALVQEHFRCELLVCWLKFACFAGCCEQFDNTISYLLVVYCLNLFLEGSHLVIWTSWMTVAGCWLMFADAQYCFVNCQFVAFCWLLVAVCSWISLILLAGCWLLDVCCCPWLCMVSPDRRS